MAYLLAFLIGIVAGLRSMTAPAAVSWTSYWGRLHLGGTWLAFLGSRWTPWILTLLALGELVADQLPFTPSRTAPLGFGGRIVTGALSGAAVGTAGGAMHDLDANESSLLQRVCRAEAFARFVKAKADRSGCARWNHRIEIWQRHRGADPLEDRAPRQPSLRQERGHE